MPAKPIEQIDLDRSAGAQLIDRLLKQPEFDRTLANVHAEQAEQGPIKY